MNLSTWTLAEICADSGLDTHDPIIDLRDVSWIEPLALVQLGMVFRDATNRQVSVGLLPPEHGDALRYMNRQRFWERFRFAVDPDANPDLFARVEKATSFNDILDLESDVGIEDRVEDYLTNTREPTPVHRDMPVAAGELVDNFRRHSKSSLGACMVQIYPRRRQASFAIGDCGIGFRGSLAQPQMDDAELIEYATQEGVTSTGEGGTGFNEIAHIVEALNGELCISSHRGFFRMNGRRKRRLTLPFSFPGVQVSVTLPLMSP